MLGLFKGFDQIHGRLTPKVSVIIPFYAGAGWLEEAVGSAVRQTYENTEIILVNDGSPEDVGGVLGRFAGKIRYFHKDNGGPGSARNLGIENSAGEFIAFLDSDDVWEERKIEKQLGLMTATGAAWSHTGYTLFRGGNPRRAEKTVDVSACRGDVFLRCLRSAPIATPCVMIRAEILRESPNLRFSEKMRYGQDSLFWINLAARYPLAAVPEVLTRVRIRGGNAARRARVQLQAKAQIWEEFIRDRARPEAERIDGATRLGYRMCHRADAAVKRLEQRGRLPKRAVEILSRGLYAAPYVLLKLREVLSARADRRRTP
ncbi:MAG: glycosyltransferase family A protein [Acidobacteriota bacterium]|jgi:glycosyltransferase involved in cell wall biosynthesis|nr:glycosyltransferase family 2 protein [Acidobacteriota bacterium]OQB58009.1 MAG: putative glycosyltransferase EpsJ [Candidatus Aminicenantes bacterium ADurb.Bin147]HOF82150.1 glycosyltransferase family A protein [Candidatus Aminicenantes bacterium]MDD8011363.1 glycosyltransferase family A protein [Acidobacteriota bacterium]MDD8029499.1 glycosyltransferase family A protein [Acidobacteriota bacterium]